MARGRARVVELEDSGLVKGQGAACKSSSTETVHLSYLALRDLLWGGQGGRRWLKW